MRTAIATHARLSRVPDLMTAESIAGAYTAMLAERDAIERRTGVRTAEDGRIVRTVETKKPTA